MCLDLLEKRRDARGRAEFIGISATVQKRFVPLETIVAVLPTGDYWRFP
jgi:hypothetical protein